MPSKKRKVLQIGKFYPPHRGGMESHLKTLCDRMLPDMDLEVVVSNAGPHTVRENCAGVPVTRLGCIARLASTSVNPAMAAEIRRSDAGLIHLHWPNPMGALAYVMSGHKAPLVVTYHSDVVKQRFLGRIFAPVLRTVLGRARAIIVSSANYAESSPLLRQYRDRCHVVPFGIADEFFAEPDAAAVRAIRERYGAGLILSAGRLVDYKGFRFLIEAMARAPGTLLIAGAGPLQRELAALAHAAGVKERVVFVGEVSDRGLRELYRAADVFVLASTDRREAFALVQAEAMAAGKPVINTALQSGVPFVSQGELTGITVPPSDAPALARAITRLLEDGSLRRDLGRAARHRAETVFRSATMAAQTLETYEIALCPKRHPIAESKNAEDPLSRQYPQNLYKRAQINP